MCAKLHGLHLQKWCGHEDFCAENLRFYHHRLLIQDTSQHSVTLGRGGAGHAPAPIAVLIDR